MQDRYWVRWECRDCPRRYTLSTMRRRPTVRHRAVTAAIQVRILAPQLFHMQPWCYWLAYARIIAGLSTRTAIKHGFLGTLRGRGTRRGEGFDSLPVSPCRK